MAEVRNTQLSLGLPDPREKSSLPVLKRVQAGIQRVGALKGPPSRPCLPITAAVMDRIRAYLVQSDHPHKDVVWAICCTVFFGFFRLGELLSESRAQITPAVSLVWGDVAVDSRERPTMVRVHLKSRSSNSLGPEPTLYWVGLVSHSARW